MRRESIASAALLVIIALLVLRPWEREPGTGPTSATALVTRVVDGDTIEAQIDGGREDVRLIGIDTPETVKPDEPVQCFGPQASRFTKQRLAGQRVHLVFGAERRDIYGRLLAYVYLPLRTFTPPKGVKCTQRRRLFNAVLLRRGLARSLTIPPNDRFAGRFRRIELSAARAGRGLWGACPP